MASLSGSDTVRAVMRAYLDQDRATMETLLADDLRFTSPQDDHIDRAAYFERCFPTSDRLSSQEIRHAVDLPGGDDVFLMYEYELLPEHGGGRFRNTEVLTVRDGQVREIQVFFGGRVQ